FRSIGVKAGAVAGRRLLALAAAVALAAAAAPPLAAASFTAQDGLAHPAGGTALVYREQHFLRVEAGRPLERLVVYRCPAGAAFARKHLDYAVSILAPDFRLDDHRSGYREGMRRRAGRVELYFRPPAGGTEKQVALPTAPGVADAGFDEFVRANWQPLLAGRDLPLRFAVPSRLRAMDFAVRKTGSARIAGEDAVVFRLRLDGLLSLVAPHIDVAYGARSRRLLRFEGLSNMRDASGRRQLNLRIDFPQPAQAASEAQWQAALAEPLAARCESGQQADTSSVRTPQSSG
ncbi:MAG: hypothetical protein ABI588_07310, partial [Arenimonas sp.]